MTSTYNSIDRLIDWHYRTVCRYQHIDTPVTRGISNLLKNFANKIKSNKFPKLQKAPFLFNDKRYKLIIKKKTEEEQTLSLPEKKKMIAFVLKKTTYPRRKTYVNHIERWGYINNITLHFTSGKLLSNIELYPSVYMTLSCFGNQSPQTIKSKQAVAEFNVIKGAIIGARSHLQKQNKFHFLYKWAFIAAGLPQIKYSSNELVKCLGIRNIFIFPELEKFNYYLFEPIGGFDLTFNVKNSSSFFS
jgi:ribosomal protein L5